MEVKEIYLDTRKVEKAGRTTFILEDERFDKPLSLKLGYDDSDKKYLEHIKSEAESYLNSMQTILTVLKEKEDRASELIDKYKKEIKAKDKKIEWLEKELTIRAQRENTVSTALEEHRKRIDSLRVELSHQQQKQAEFAQSLSKQPMVFRDKIFISWNEEVMLGVFEVKDGDYISLLSVEIGEHNEYVQNGNWVFIDKVHAQWGYMPKYRLFWGTEFDTPTATVYYTLLLIPL